MRSEIYGRCVVVASWDGTSVCRLVVFYLTTRDSRSHETTPSLPPPTPASFPLDFAQVLQATTASPARGRRRVALAGTGTGMARDAVAGAGPDRSTSGVWPPTRRRPERIAEEEGWEVVEEDGGDDGLG